MIKVLCVEDEEDLREDLIEELAEDGFAVAAAANGLEGLRKLVSFKPDLVICDCLMPVMTGTEMLKEIHANYPQFTSVPFIFLSAHAERSHVDEGIAIGASRYITKPVDYEELLKLITKLCGTAARIPAGPAHSSRRSASTAKNED